MAEFEVIDNCQSDLIKTQLNQESVFNESQSGARRRGWRGVVGRPLSVFPSPSDSGQHRSSRELAAPVSVYEPKPRESMMRADLSSGPSPIRRGERLPLSSQERGIGGLVGCAF